MPQVNHRILTWARKTAALSRDEAARSLKLPDWRGLSPEQRLEAIEEGRTEATRPLLLKMARLYRRPLVTFYLPAVPPKGNRGRDFRTLPNDHSEADDALLDALLRNIQARQRLLRALLLEDDDIEPLQFVGSATVSDGAGVICQAIRQQLGLDLNLLRSHANPEDAFAFLRERTEAAGVFVLLAGNLGSYHTDIDLETFRGYALADSIAPLIVVNNHDSHAAWSFTLLHELTHIWLGATGISGERANLSIERFCNEVAGELLLPESEIASLTVNAQTQFTEALRRIRAFATERNISATMTAYKLYRTGRIRRHLWLKLHSAYRRMWLDSRERKRRQLRERKGGPDYYVIRRHRLGPAMLNTVASYLAEGVVSTTRAAMLLGVAPANLGHLLRGISSTGSRR